MKYLLGFMLLCYLPIFAQTKTYVVRKTPNDFLVTGDGSAKEWENAIILSDFSNQYQPKNLPETNFKALWSNTHLYFLYYVEDHEIITQQRGIEELDTAKSDRVEIFFKPDDETKPYFSLEMDALGRHLDSDAEFYKNNIDLDWDWPTDDFVLKASQHSKGYTVEGSISLESLRTLGIYKDDGYLNTGLYRGEYYSNADNKVSIKWISWVVTSTERPNFHVPNSFGILKLETLE
ncbi:carbohydrate-binding family 9-like protein [Zobellia nedashkovskayae]